MLHVICSIAPCMSYAFNYALWHWANSESDLQTLQQSARAATFERQLCQMSLGQLNFDGAQFLVDLRRRTNFAHLSVPWPMMPIHI